MNFKSKTDLQVTTVISQYLPGINQAQKKLNELFRLACKRKKGEKYGIVSINEIIDCILENNPLMQKFLRDYNGKTINDTPFLWAIDMKFNDLSIDISLQREINVYEMVWSIIRANGFNESLAAPIDVFYRYCYGKKSGLIPDGFRRTIMAILCGKKSIKGIEYRTEKNNDTEDECAILEAEFFNLKNQGVLPLNFEQIFKSGIRMKNPDDLLVKNVLNSAGLDIGNVVNPDAVSLKKLQEIYKTLLGQKPNNQNAYTHYYSHRDFIETSNFYIKTFNLSRQNEDSPNIDDLTAICRLKFKIEDGYMKRTFNFNYDSKDLFLNLKNFIIKNKKKQGQLTLGKTTQSKNKTAEFILIKNLFNLNKEMQDHIKKIWCIDHLI
jgi:hypothetical protein